MHWGNIIIPSLMLPYTATAEPSIPTIHLESLDQFPTLKLFAAILTVILPLIGGLLYLKAAYFKPKPEQPITFDASGGVKIDAASVMFYQGPLKAIFDLLTDIRGRQSLSRLEVREDFAALLSANRKAICDTVGTALRDLEARNENRFRDVMENVNSVHERIDGVNENVVRIDGKLDGRRK